MEQTLFQTTEDLEAILREGHLPSLVGAAAHLGDAAVSDLAPLALAEHRDGVQGPAAADFRRAVAAAMQAQAAQRRPPRPVAGEALESLMRLVAGDAVPPDYAPLLQEELSLGVASSRSLGSAANLGRLAPPGFRVAVIGAGASGLLAAIRLAEAGLDVVVLEKNADVGGTWLENTYPGCRVDVPNQTYSYSFETNTDWSQNFCQQAELLAYFRRCADRYGVRSRIRFGTTVEAARFLDDESRWALALRCSDGSTPTLVVDVVITATGQLNRPALPDIPGRERFAGAAFHSAQWPQGLDLTGKRVAVVGSGASAVQVAPAIAAQVAELVVFQRTPPWLAPTPDYYDDVSAGQKWLLRHMPFYANWNRFWLFWSTADSLYGTLVADPDWREPGSVSARNAQARARLEQYIARQLTDRPDLLARAIPDYPPGGKRLLRDNGLWFETLKRPNARLVTDRIVDMTAEGIITRDGRLHQVDAIVYCTGFEASRFLAPMQVTGPGGLQLDDHWGGDARAFLGLAIPGFPNFFSLYGPNTNIAANGSIIFLSECGVRYVLSCLETMLARGARTLTVRTEVHDAYNAEIDAANARMAWGSPGISSWFKNETGRVSQNWPFPLFEYWRRTLRPDPAHFHFS